MPDTKKTIDKVKDGAAKVINLFLDKENRTGTPKQNAKKAIKKLWPFRQGGSNSMIK